LLGEGVEELAVGERMMALRSTNQRDFDAEFAAVPVGSITMVPDDLLIQREIHRTNGTGHMLLAPVA